LTRNYGLRYLFPSLFYIRFASARNSAIANIGDTDDAEKHDTDVALSLTFTVTRSRWTTDIAPVYIARADGILENGWMCLERVFSRKRHC